MKNTASVDPCKNSLKNLDKNSSRIFQEFYKNSSRIPEEILQEEEATGYWNTIRIRLQTSTKYDKGTQKRKEINLCLAQRMPDINYSYQTDVPQVSTAMVPCHLIRY